MKKNQQGIPPTYTLVRSTTNKIGKTLTMTSLASFILLHMHVHISEHAVVSKLFLGERSGRLFLLLPDISQPQG
jgi:hypothetical protein